MSLQSLLDRIFQTSTRHYVNRTASQCLTTLTRIVGHNPNRLSLIIVNLGANNVYISFDRDVSTTKGILITPNGGSFVLSYDVDFNLCGFEIWGIATGGACNIYTAEVIGEQ